VILIRGLPLMALLNFWPFKTHTLPFVKLFFNYWDFSPVVTKFLTLSLRSLHHILTIPKSKQSPNFIMGCKHTSFWYSLKGLRFESSRIYNIWCKIVIFFSVNKSNSWLISFLSRRFTTITCTGVKMLKDHLRITGWEPLLH